MMTDESKAQKTEKPTIENLELNRETLQDLTEQEGDQAKGGVRGGSPACENGPTYGQTCNC